MQTDFMVCFQRLALTSAVFLATFAFISIRSAKAQTIEQTGRYVSPADTGLTIHTATVLPVVDNVGGIYARPLQEELTRLIHGYHQWDFVDPRIEKLAARLDDMEEHPSMVKDLTKNIDADLFIAALASKTAKGVSVRMDFFLKSDGKLLAQDSFENDANFATSELKTRADEMFTHLLSKVPYSGLVLSRQQNRVTLNLGRVDGISKDQTLTVIHFVKTNRHPKFGFLVGTEKEILGTVKITRAENALSFGTILTEKDRGAIQRDSKLAKLGFVSYPDPSELGDNGGGINDRADKNIAFGKNAHEWVPAEPPTFGQVGLKLGIGSYKSSVHLTNSTTGTDNSLSSSSVFPDITAFGELWLTPRWSAHLDITEGVTTLNNPYTGSAPSSLSATLTRYQIWGGYNFFFKGDDFFGPKIQLHGGFAGFNFHIDDSNPRAFTSVNYFGLLLGVTGSLPITDDERWSVGATLDFTLLPHMNESPERSGDDPSHTLATFTFFGEYKFRQNINLISSVDFASLHTSFSGGGRADGDTASNLSNSYTTFNIGAAYLF